MGAKYRACDLVRQESGRELEALGRPRDSRARFDEAHDVAENFAKRVARHDEDGIAGPLQAAREIGLDSQQLGESGLWQVALVAALAAHAQERCRIAAPQPHTMPRTRELDRERGPP